MYERRAAVGQAVQFGSRLVAQLRALPGVEHSRPELRRAAHWTGKSRVDAPVDLLPPPAPDLVGDRARGYPAAERLLARDHACLKTR